MLEAKITITVPDLSEAINHLADALTARSGTSSRRNKEVTAQPEKAASAPAVAVSDACPVDVPCKPENTPPAVPDTPPVPVTSAAAAPAPAPAPAPDPIPSVPAPTLEQLSTAGAALMTSGKMGDLRNLLLSFNVQALTQLPSEKYGEFAEGLRKLGANI